MLNFLDVAGSWDPSLGLVMAGALTVTAPGFAIARRRAPILAPEFEIPTATDIDRPLVLGAVLFGVGWGLVGLCPGPALTSLGIAAGRTGLFVAALVVGSVVGNRLRP